MAESMRKSEPVPNGIYSLTAHFEGKLADVQRLYDVHVAGLQRSIDEIKNAAKEDRHQFATKSEIAAIVKAVDVAATAMNERLANMNEIKSAMKDSLGTHVTKAELDALREKLDSDVDGLQDRIDRGITGLRERSELDIKVLREQVSDGKTKLGTLIGILIGSNVFTAGLVAALVKLIGG